VKTPLQHHNRRHRKRPEPFETCRRCLFDKAVCEKKIRFHTFVEADEWVLELNMERGWKPPLMSRYRCMWCLGWHMKKARDGRERARAQRVFRNWVLKLVDEDKDALVHWVRTGEVKSAEEEPSAA
jgi:hypothetical protein